MQFHSDKLDCSSSGAAGHLDDRPMAAAFSRGIQQTRASQAARECCCSLHSKSWGPLETQAFALELPPQTP